MISQITYPSRHLPLFRLAGAVCSLAFASWLNATTVLTFSNGDSFDNDVVSDTAGPFNDPVSGLSATLTTTGLAPDGALNTTASGLGINASADAFGDAFDDGESWTFTLDSDAEWTGINFAVFSTATESFTVSSTAWQGQAFSPTDTDISFTSGTGAFTFASGDFSDDFDLNDLSGGSTIAVTSGTAVQISFSDTASGAARLETISFDLVPEPSTGILAILGGSLLVLRRRRL